MARRSRTGRPLTGAQTEAGAWRAGLYARISVEDGDDTEQNSIGNQRKIAESFLADRTDIIPADTYCDNGYTGMSFERPGFRKMLEDIHSGKINCIIVKDISRLGRHFVMTGDFVEHIFPEMGVRLICVNDGYDSTDVAADTAELTLPLKMVMNDCYVRDISAKIRSSIHARMDSGEYLPASGSIPYGYRRDAENRTFAIDAEAAPVVLRIFRMRAEGTSFNGICRTLNAEGIPCPGRLRYERGMTAAEKYKEALWIRGTVRKLTGDITYLGCRVHGKTGREKVGLPKKYRPEEEWRIIENTHAPIVTEKLFDRVQQVNARELEKRRGYAGRNGFREDHRELFQGLVYCADCHSLMSAGKSCARAGANTPSRIFYDCNTYRYSAHMRCASHYIRQEQLYSAVKNAIEQQIRVAVDVERLVADLTNAPHTLTKEIQGLSERRKRTEERMERLLEDLAERVIDRNEYEYMKGEYSRQLSTLLAEEERAAARKKAEQEKLSEAQAWLHSMREYQALAMLTPEIMRVLVKKISVHNGQRIAVEFNFSDPYKAVAELQGGREEGRQVG